MAATCSVKSFSWMTDSSGQSPCDLASKLYEPCNGPTFILSRLSPNSHNTPGDASHPSTACSCSWAVYNLLQACAVCQDVNGIQNIATWAMWITGCYTYNKTVIPNSYARFSVSQSFRLKDRNFNTTLGEESAQQLDKRQVRSRRGKGYCGLGDIPVPIAELFFYFSSYSNGPCSLMHDWRCYTIHFGYNCVLQRRARQRRRLELSPIDETTVTPNFYPLDALVPVDPFILPSETAATGIPHNQKHEGLTHGVCTSQGERADHDGSGRPSTHIRDQPERGNAATSGAERIEEVWHEDGGSMEMDYDPPSYNRKTSQRRRTGS